MALPVETRSVSPQEYLEMEREAEYKSEYLDGEIFAMSGGTARHSLIATQTLVALGLKLKGKSRKPYNSDLRIAVSPDGLYTYPDVSVFCEPMEFVFGSDDTASNPAVVVEVLSKNTEAYDRGRKFGHYRQIATLRHYVLVSQDSPTIECFSREGDGRWALSEAIGLEASMPLGALGIELPLAEIYEGVEFPARTEKP